MPAEPTRRPWWRCIRFSLRGLIVLVLVIGGSLGWIVHRARVQREAVAAIKKAGGIVEYEGRDWGRLNSLPGRPVSGSWASSWLVKLVGVDYFDRVVHIALTEEASAAALPHIKDLPHLRFLFLEAPCVTDADLEYLEGHHELELLPSMTRSPMPG